MNRFQKKGAEAQRRWILLSCFFFLLLLFVFFREFTMIADGNRQRQKDVLKDALNRSIVQCYALEGRYPESLEYLVKNYGIIYDQDEFFIDYEIIGANIMPEVTILEKR